MKQLSPSIKKRVLSAFLCIFTLIPFLLTGCTSAKPDISSANQPAASFSEFCEELFVSEVSSNTINLHFTLSDPSSYGISDASITLGEISDRAVNETNASLENTLNALKQFDYGSLTKQEQLTYDVLMDSLTHQLSGSSFYLYEEYLNPASGIQSQLPVLYEEYRFHSEQDVKDYLELISLTGSYFKSIASFEKGKADAGLFMSDAACDKVIAQCKDFVSDKENHYLILTFDHKVDALASLTETQREQYKKENETLVKEVIFPAYEKLSAVLSALKGSGKNDKGLCYFDNGKSYYETLFYHNTGCSDRIKDVETKIDNQRLLDLKAAIALTDANPSIPEICENYSIPDTDPQAILDSLQQNMLAQFPAPPKTTYTVSPIEECMQDYMAPAFYITAPLDDYEQNSIFINGKTPSHTMRYFTTLAHEGFPGHLYQTVMSYEAGLPPIRFLLNYPGYIEGWATYVEMLSYQYATLPSDAAQWMAYNQSALLSLYASTDIGIHYEGWDLADTIKFWKSYGISDVETIQELYQYIISEPANYLKYYVGYLEFLELQNTAKEMFQTNYCDTDFHRALLTIGPAPFDLIEKYLPFYYSSKDGRP